MRILFNHGLTPEDLYTNAPKKIIDRKWRWFIKHYGSTTSYEDAISDPFKYTIGLVLNRVLDERVRFKLPVNCDAYFDFEIINGDRFELQRQNGRFQEIDFIESDFTGYSLRYYFKAKAYQKHYPIYLGGDLKQKFLSGINSGIKYYTVKDITLNDVIDEVYKKFPELTKKEVKNLVLLGFRRMQSSMMYGCAITINTTKFMNCYAYIGKLSLNPFFQIKEYSIRRDKKLRKIDVWKKPPYDGYYYIGLNPVALETWLEENKKARTKLTFRNVIARRLKEELYYKYKTVHIFRIPVKKFKGWTIWIEKSTFRDVEYIGEVNSHKFSPADKTWKDLIKEYEKRSS